MGLALGTPVHDASQPGLSLAATLESVDHLTHAKQSRMKLERVLYRAYAHVVVGRDGGATVSQSNLDLKLTLPKRLDRRGGDATSPEQFFAAGYSSCFVGAEVSQGARKDRPC